MVSTTSSPVMPSMVVGIWVGSEVGRTAVTVTVPSSRVGASSASSAPANEVANVPNAVTSAAMNIVEVFICVLP